jgi:hypothetical protein
MTADLRLQVIRRAVGELVSFEGGLAATLERARQVRPGQPDVLSAIERFRPMVQTHRDQLATYLKDLGGGEPSGEAMTSESTPSAPDGLSQVLRGLCLAFSHCVFSYAMLYEMALRLYEPRLREIAPTHLRAYADAAQSATRLLPAVVAWQLAQDGLHCSCICPMCGLGACGCVAFGTQTLIAAWRDAGAAESTPPGFVLQPPKPESELARAGVQGGELLLAVDGQQVRVVADIQAAIRKHVLGDEVRLLVQRASESPRELNVRHVSDYPRT